MASGIWALANQSFYDQIARTRLCTQRWTSLTQRTVEEDANMPRTATRGAAMALLLLGSEISAFSLRLPPAQRSTPRSKTLLQAHSGRRAAFAAAATALTTSLTANAAPADQRWAASEFFDEVRNGAVDRVTFAAEGGALVAVDCRAESKFHGCYRRDTPAQWFHTGRC